MSNSTCSAANCASEGKLSGMCRMHYYQNWRARARLESDQPGNVEARFWPKVEKGPGCWEWIGSKARGHGKLGVKGRTVYAHRISYELMNGPIPDGLEIDHMCHNRGCVNPEHLRAVTSKQNNENRLGANPNSKSGVRGVHWRNDCEKWQVTIHAGPKMHHVGYFTDLEAARQAAIDKRNELFTHNDTDRKAA